MVQCPLLMQLIKQLKTARHSFYIVVVANHIFIVICLFICMVWMPIAQVWSRRGVTPLSEIIVGDEQLNIFFCCFLLLIHTPF